MDVGKSAGYRDRWIGAISNTITAAVALEEDSEFLQARKHAQEVSRKCCCDDDDHDDDDDDDDDDDVVFLMLQLVVDESRSRTGSVSSMPRSRTGTGLFYIVLD